MSNLVINPLDTNSTVVTEKVTTENVVNKDIRVCRCCLECDGQLYSLTENLLDSVFNDLTGLNISGGFACITCVDLLRKYNDFRERCHAAAFTLNCIDVDLETIKSINRDNVKHNLNRSEPIKTNNNTNFRIKSEKLKCLGLTEIINIDIPANTNDDDDNDFKVDDNFDDVNDVSDLDDKNSIKKEEMLSDENVGSDGEDSDVQLNVTDVVEQIDDNVICVDDDEDSNEDNKTDDCLNAVKVVQSELLNSDGEDSNVSDVDEQIDDSVICGYDDEGTNEDNETNDCLNADEGIESGLLDFFCCNICQKITNTPLNEVLHFIYKLSQNKLKKSSSKFLHAENDVKDFLKLIKELSDFYKVDAMFTDIKELEESRKKIANSKRFKNSPYKCDLCVRVLTKDKFNGHMVKYHNLKTPFVCNICLYRFNSTKLLYAHALRHLIQLKCKNCLGSFATWQQARMHHGSDCKRVEISCHICGDMFHSTKEFSAHYEYRHVRQTKKKKKNTNRKDTITKDTQHAQKIPLRQSVSGHNSPAPIKDKNDTQQNMEVDDENDDFTWPEHNMNTNADSRRDASLPDSIELMENVLNILISIQARLKKGNVFDVFQTIYEESPRLMLRDGNEEFTRAENGIRTFMDLNNKLCELYNMEVELCDREGMRAYFEAKKETKLYKNAINKCELCCRIFKPGEIKRYEGHYDTLHKPSMKQECEICHRRYHSKKSLLKHAVQHFRKIQCRTCGAHFINWQHAIWHRKKVCGDVLCDLCGQIFDRMTKYYDHYREIHLRNCDQQGTKCLLCKKVLYGKAGLRIHMNHVHLQAVQCKCCEVWYLNEDINDKHLQPDGVCRPDKSCCPVCGVSFDSEELMMQHNESCSQEKTISSQAVECVPCMRTFKNEKSFNNHLKTSNHLKRQKNMRPECLELILQNRERKGSVRVRRNISKAGRVCPFCGRDDFKGTQMYEDHVNLHTGEKPYECDICNKTFRMKTSLKIHMLIHTGERHYQCTLCDKSFKQHSHLRAHMPLHSGVKAYECTYCQKRFRHRSSMIVHLRTEHQGGPKRKRDRRPRKKIDNELYVLN